MSGENDLKAASIDHGVVLAALRAELAARGHHLASDTAGMHRALHIMGPNDVARALFEFKSSADDAVNELLRQGAWVDGMPPRFAVLPGTEADNSSLEMLEQMRAIPLLFDSDGDTVTFRDLDRLLRTHIDEA